MSLILNKVKTEIKLIRDMWYHVEKKLVFVVILIIALSNPHGNVLSKMLCL